MIDVSELINDPDFAQRYQVIRTTKDWVGGRYETISTETLNFTGIVQPASTDDLEQFPEAARIKTMMKFFCRPPNNLYMSEPETGAENERTISDTIIFKGEEYNLLKVADWYSNGYIRAFGALRYG